MNCSMPGLPVHHQLLEFTQTHVRRVGDAIQPSHPLSSPSPPALNLSQHPSFPMSQFFTSGDQNTGASASILLINIQGWFPLRSTGFISLLFRRLSGVFSSTAVWRHQFFGVLLSLQSSFHYCTWPLRRSYGIMHIPQDECIVNLEIISYIQSLFAVMKYLWPVDTLHLRGAAAQTKGFSWPCWAAQISPLQLVSPMASQGVCIHFCASFLSCIQWKGSVLEL